MAFLVPADEDQDLFLAAVDGVEELPDRKRARVSREIPAQPDPGGASTFVVDVSGSRVEGRAQGVSRKQIEPMRRGRIEPDATLDLHRMDRARAAAHVRERVAASRQAGHRYLLIIHGRGLHSQEGPVLRDAVVATLGRTGSGVRAFHTAAKRHGGAGALYVELERQ